MNHLVVDGCPPWDGEYELDGFEFTNRELNTIKNISGIRGGELLDAIISEDASAFVALAVVTLGRAGKHVDPDDFWDAKRTAIRLELGGDESPPAQTPSDEGTPENPDFSGSDSADVGD